MSSTSASAVESLQRPAVLLPPTSSGAAIARPHALPLQPHHEQQKCCYASKRCDNPRVLKRNGELHRLCASHRALANRNQRRLDARRRLQVQIADARALSGCASIPSHDWSCTGLCAGEPREALQPDPSLQQQQQRGVYFREDELLLQLHHQQQVHTQPALEFDDADLEVLRALLFDDSDNDGDSTCHLARVNSSERRAFDGADHLL